jgi:acyl carrier protein
MNQSLVEAVSSILNIQPETVKPDTSATNTPTWDSLAHLRLILEIEHSLGIRFKTQDIPKLTSVALLDQAVLELKR